jgi:hypothetical protein
MRQGQSVKAAGETLRLPLALETLYHVLARMRQRLDGLRRWLCRKAQAPRSAQRQALLQTVEHLSNAFPQAVCPLAEFQAVFQQPLLG